jgi:competence protein ComGF
MMVRIDYKEQLYLPGLETWRDYFSPRKQELLLKSWAETFRVFILPNLPVSEVAKFYSASMGRKTKELYSIIGLVILQTIFDVTDAEAIRRFGFDQEWHFALECFKDEDQLICQKTLYTMRDIIAENDLASTIFENVTDIMVKALKIDVSKQRLDSVHVNSNMTKMGRVRLIARAIINFLRNLKRRHFDQFEIMISQEMKDKYLKKSSDSYFNQIKPSESRFHLRELADDANFLLIVFQAEAEVSNMNTFKMLCRIFSEQCRVEDNQVIVRKPKEISSGSVQNPSDPDAGYDAHKGQGYQTQLLESYKTAEDRKGIDGNKPDMILYAETESADKHDSNALESAVKEIFERGLYCDILLTDAAYGGTRNVEFAQEYGARLVAPIYGTKSEGNNDSFEFDRKTYEVTACPAGKKPDKIKHYNELSITVTWYEETCSNCSFSEECPTKKCPKGRSYHYEKKSIKCHFRREYENTDAFREEYRYRSGIEATNSRFISMTYARRSRYRGLTMMIFSQKLKALGINMFRITKYNKDGGIFGYLIEHLTQIFVFENLQPPKTKYMARYFRKRGFSPVLINFVY